MVKNHFIYNQIMKQCENMRMRYMHWLNQLFISKASLCSSLSVASLGDERGAPPPHPNHLPSGSSPRPPPLQAVARRRRPAMVPKPASKLFHPSPLHFLLSFPVCASSCSDAHGYGCLLWWRIRGLRVWIRSLRYRIWCSQLRRCGCSRWALHLPPWLLSLLLCALPLARAEGAQAARCYLLWRVPWWARAWRCHAW